MRGGLLFAGAIGKLAMLQIPHADEIGEMSTFSGCNLCLPARCQPAEKYTPEADKKQTTYKQSCANLSVQAEAQEPQANLSRVMVLDQRHAEINDCSCILL